MRSYPRAITRPTASQVGLATDQYARATTRDWFYYMDSHGEFELGGPARSQVVDTITDYCVPTDVFVRYDSDPTFSGSAETDAVYQSGPVSSSDEGYTYCDDPADGTIWRCDQHYIRIEPGKWTPGLTCH